MLITLSGEFSDARRWLTSNAAHPQQPCPDLYTTLSANISPTGMNVSTEEIVIVRSVFWRIHLSARTDQGLARINTNTHNECAVQFLEQKLG